MSAPKRSKSKLKMSSKSLHSKSKFQAPPPSTDNETISSQSSIESKRESHQDEEVHEIKTTLPEMIITNPHSMMTPEQVSFSDLTIKRKVHEKKVLIWCQEEKEPRIPIPTHPMFLAWWPKLVTFHLQDEPVTQKLTITNRSEKIMFIQCWGLWNETAREGAHWQYWPETRIHLAPCLKTILRIRATPRKLAPVPVTMAGLQLSTGYFRDNVMGHFLVPICVSFANYALPKAESSTVIVT